MQPSQSIIEFIKKQEGFRPITYRPTSTDRFTIGYGSTRIKGEKVQPGDTITQAKAEEQLIRDVTYFSDRINQYLTVPVSQQQFDAVVSLCYNIGFNLFYDSNTGKAFFKGEDIGDMFHKWNTSKGVVLAGLTTRRAEEAKIYKDGEYTT